MAFTRQPGRARPGCQHYMHLAGGSWCLTPVMYLQGGGQEPLARCKERCGRDTRKRVDLGNTLPRPPLSSLPMMPVLLLQMPLNVMTHRRPQIPVTATDADVRGVKNEEERG